MNQHNSGPLTIEAVLFCDDVRVEDNGKHIFVGAYTGSIVVKDMPTQLGLVAFILLRVNEAVDTVVSFKCDLDDENLNAVKGRLSATLADTQPITLPFLAKNIEAPGTLSVSMQVGDGDWQQIAQRTVTTFDMLPKSES